jgi:hypothetical protein
MKKIKEHFQNDPIFATTVIITGAIVVTGLLKAVASTITSTAYAYRASKL